MHSIYHFHSKRKTFITLAGKKFTRYLLRTYHIQRNSGKYLLKRQCDEESRKRRGSPIGKIQSNHLFYKLTANAVVFLSVKSEKPNKLSTNTIPHTKIPYPKSPSSRMGIPLHHLA